MEFRNVNPSCRVGHFPGPLPLLHSRDAFNLGCAGVCASLGWRLATDSTLNRDLVCVELADLTGLGFPARVYARAGGGQRGSCCCACARLTRWIYRGHARLPFMPVSDRHPPPIPAPPHSWGSYDWLRCPWHHPFQHWLCCRNVPAKQVSCGIMALTYLLMQAPLRFPMRPATASFMITKMRQS